jgi:multicomponent Na+:H+ antiporter subunit D
LLTLAIVIMGLWPAPIVEFCEKAAADLLNPSGYIHFILN